MHLRITIACSLLTLLLMGPLVGQQAAAAEIEFCKQVFDLPGTVSEAVLAARGRKVLLRIAETNSIVVFDLVAGKIVKKIPRGESWRMAAGQNMLILIDSESAKLERWTLDPIALADAETLSMRPPIGAIAIGAIAIGCGSDGPLLVLPGSGRSEQVVDDIKLLDLQTLQPTQDTIEMAGRGGLPAVDWDQVRTVTASTVGNAFCIPEAQCVVRIEGPDVYARYVDTKQKTLFPGNIGEYFYGPPTPIDSIFRQLPSGRAERTAEDYTRGDVDGPFYLQMRTAGIALAGTAAALASPPASVPTSKQLPDGSMTPVVAYLVSGANLMFSLIDDNRRLERITFDAERLTSHASEGVLKVLTRPQTFVRGGTEFRYQVRSLTSGAKATYSLENGPQGMQVSKSGLVTWTVPTRLRDNITTAMVRVNCEPDLTTIQRFELEIYGATIDPAARPSAVLLTSPVEDPTAIKPLKLSQPSQQVLLASRVHGAVVAGAGRFLLLRMHAPSKLAVFDVTRGKVAGYLPLPSERSLVAGGADCVVIVEGERVERWKLADLSFDRSAVLPLPKFRARIPRSVTQAPHPSHVLPTSVLMGAATTGPITIAFPPALQYSSNGSFVFLDGQSLQSVKLRSRGSVDRRTVVGSRMSANGHLLSNMHQAMRYEGESIQGLPTGNNWRELLPTADGRFLLGDGIALTDRIRLAGFKFNGIAIPAVHGPYFLLVDRPPRHRFASKRATKETVSVGVLGDDRPLAQIATSHPVIRGSRYSNGPSQLPYDQRLWLIPRAKLVIELNPDRDRLVLHQLDIDEVLENCTYPYLFFDSSPQLAIQAGKKWTYRPRVRCQHEPATLRVPIAPRWMRLGGDGLLAWQTTEQDVGVTEQITIVAADAEGFEAQQTFRLSVYSPGQP